MLILCIRWRHWVTSSSPLISGQIRKLSFLRPAVVLVQNLGFFFFCKLSSMKSRHWVTSCCSISAQIRKMIFILFNLPAPPSGTKWDYQLTLLTRSCACKVKCNSNIIHQVVTLNLDNDCFFTCSPECRLDGRVNHCSTVWWMAGLQSISHLSIAVSWLFHADK